MRLLAIDVGGTFIKYAQVDDGDVLSRKGKIPTPTERPEAFYDAMSAILGRFSGAVEGVAVSLPGVVDAERGYMYTGGRLKWVRDLEMRCVLRKLFGGLPVQIENDAKAAALAELTSGALRGCRTAAVVLCGTALGGGVICGGQVLRGRHHFAGELSYAPYLPWDGLGEHGLWGQLGGVGCLCGALARRTGEAPEAMTGEELFTRAENGELQPLCALHDFCRRLARLFWNIECLLDPERIAVGGGISARPLFLQILREEMDCVRRDGLAGLEGLITPELVPCRYGNDANLLGAVYHFRMMSAGSRQNGVVAMGEEF